MDPVSVIAVLGGVATILVSVNTIIEECEKYYNHVNEALERINAISDGEFTTYLIESGSKLKIHYRDLINGMKKMLEAIQAVHDENEQADETAANSLKSANSKY